MAHTEIKIERFGKKKLKEEVNKLYLARISQNQREININKAWKTIKIGYNDVEDKINFLI
jgi:hypothetical protein